MYKITVIQKNTYNLIEKLYNIHVNKNTKLYSFDINNMYTNIPIKIQLILLQVNLDIIIKLIIKCFS